MNKRSILLWICALAMLSVGARNFEKGLSVDGCVYATIAREIARSGEWFRLNAKLPDFIPFTEHPHLGLWIHALVFKSMGAGDWSARLPSHLAYVGFLFLLFSYIRKKSSESVAISTVLLLWIWPRFSNFMSNAYLDPMALFFAFAGFYCLEEGLDEDSLAVRSIEFRSVALSFGAGLFLAFSAMTKGLTVLGFGPCCAFLVFKKAKKGRSWLLSLSCLSTLALVLLLYAWALSRSAVPDFLSLYWKRQIADRIAPSWSFRGLTERAFWFTFLKDTFFLLPLVVLPFLRKQKNSLVIPALFFVTFVFLYAPAHKYGSQYWLWLMPWVAWLISEGFSPWLNWGQRSVRVTGSFAMAAVFVIQYFPLPTHRPLAKEILYLQSREQELGLKTLSLDASPQAHDFTSAAGFAWYDDLDLQYLKEGVPLSDAPHTASLFISELSPARKKELGFKGWTLDKNFPSGASLWVKPFQ